MILSQLFLGIGAKEPLPDLDILTIARDSRQVETGSLFFCIVGVESDGHDYAAQALAGGAAAIVVERDLGLAQQILVESTHQAYGTACGNYFGNPASQLKLIGVTGTNGKTTITYIVKGILEAAGYTTGLIGTIENQIGSVRIQARHTTPDPYQLHALLARMVEAGCQYVVMEASSHALDQQRMAGLQFRSAGFTNLTQDHLDYHQTMERYFEAKKKLFETCDLGVINADDSYGEVLLSQLEIPHLSFSLENPNADLWARDLNFSQHGSHFVLQYGEESQAVRFIQPGRFSVSNALCAAGLCLGVGLSFSQVADGLGHCGQIPGRFERIPTNSDFTVIRDFAHSPAGLENLLSTIRDFAEGRIITLFGCAGERDRGKRKEMAATVAKYSDLCIMTADNPRREPISQILEDALPGFEGQNTPYRTFEDRFDGVLWALGQAKPGDMLILAGKGHEDYQVLPYGSVNFDERELVGDLLSRMDAGEHWGS